jgi:HPt (histidine-containing phosphotransfer) domain-containing protein
MDFKELGANLGLDEDEFLELVELFLSSAASDIDKLQKAYEDMNINQAADAAHSLKGSSGNLGFTEFYEIAKEIEDGARKNNIDRLDTSLIELKGQLTHISDCLKNNPN